MEESKYLVSGGNSKIYLLEKNKIFKSFNSFIDSFNEIIIYSYLKKNGLDVNNYLGYNEKGIFMKKYNYSLDDYIELNKHKGQEKWIFYNILKKYYEVLKVGFYHFDIKSHNILINDENDLFISDWGNSTAIMGRLYNRKPPAIISTISYRAPEIYNREHIYSAADIFSLAIIGIELFYDKPDLFYNRYNYNEAKNYEKFLNNFYNLGVNGTKYYNYSGEDEDCFNDWESSCDSECSDCSHGSDCSGDDSDDSGDSGDCSNNHCDIIQEIEFIKKQIPEGAIIQSFFTKKINDDLRDLILRMSNYRPEDRPSIADCLNHKCFEEFRGNMIFKNLSYEDVINFPDASNKINNFNPISGESRLCALYEISKLVMKVESDIYTLFSLYNLFLMYCKNYNFKTVLALLIIANNIKNNIIIDHYYLKETLKISFSKEELEAEIYTIIKYLDCNILYTSPILYLKDIDFECIWNLCLYYTFTDKFETSYKIMKRILRADLSPNIIEKYFNLNQKNKNKFKKLLTNAVTIYNTNKDLMELNKKI